jgi:hypothetical protein
MSGMTASVSMRSGRASFYTTIYACMLACVYGVYLIVGINVRWIDTEVYIYLGVYIYMKSI